MRLILAGLVSALLVAPSVATACSVCVGTGTPETRDTWLAMTAFMTFTPLLVVLSVAFWLRHRFKAMEAAEQRRQLGIATAEANTPGAAGFDVRS
jgi:integral membrane sensor domain MASE1